MGVDMVRNVAVSTLRPRLDSESLELQELAPRDSTNGSTNMPLVRLWPHEESDVLDDIPSDTSAPQARRRKLLMLRFSFFLFGLINEVLYVIILSAALDLAPPSTPKGIIAFCNIFPGLVAKIGWPYFLKGKIRYARRVIGCVLLSCTGMLVIITHESLPARLLGISLASFSTGMGELTFLQLSTTYGLDVGGQSVGFYATGTGTAGLGGASLWWVVRGLGVRVGVGISSVLPLILLLAYFLLLPPPAAFMDSLDPGAYVSLPEEDPDTRTLDAAEGDTLYLEQLPKVPVSLNASDKWRLVKPMIWKYILPLFLVYTFEYTTNQGITPTLLYPVPQHGFLSKIIHTTRDYYPLWQLVYRSTLFVSRASIAAGLPPIPEKLLSFPTIAQFVILVTLMYQSAVGIFPEDHPTSNILFVFLVISIEGVFGGLAYVNMFYRVNQERSDPATVVDGERSRQEREFRMGSMGFADASGVLLASLLAVPTEVQLCRAQVARGKTLCKGL